MTARMHELGERPRFALGLVLIAWRHGQLPFVEQRLARLLALPNVQAPERSRMIASTGLKEKSAAGTDRWSQTEEVHHDVGLLATELHKRLQAEKAARASAESTPPPSPAPPETAASATN
jgi:ferric-dicitrate binding protein FerR (iron transport regulator)